MKEFKTSDGVWYEVDNNGVIHQKDPEPFTYDEEYVATYDDPKYADKSLALSALRFSQAVAACGGIPNYVMDYGYGDGSYLKFARTYSKVRECHGHDITGRELPDGCLFATRPLLGEQKDKWFKPMDVVSFWDVLEHLPDMTIVKHIDTKFLIITLPWCHYQQQGEEWFDSWRHRKPNEHLHHFSAFGLGSFMRDMGYKTLWMSNIEDSIRTPTDYLENILTGVFAK